MAKSFDPYSNNTLLFIPWLNEIALSFTSKLTKLNRLSLPNKINCSSFTAYLIKLLYFDFKLIKLPRRLFDNYVSCLAFYSLTP